MGKKTLLIDADLRKPVLHKMFPNPSIGGLTSFLSGEINQVDDIVYSSDVENLSIVKCGVSPPNPSELLASKAMEEFIEQAKNNFDVILFDIPFNCSYRCFCINKIHSKVFVSCQGFSNSKRSSSKNSRQC